jgi:hypothetical protein
MDDDKDEFDVLDALVNNNNELNHSDRLRLWRQAAFLDWERYLKTYDFHWFGTFTLKEYDCHLKAEELLRTWTRQICKAEHIQVGYFYIYCENHGHAHIHVLMVGSNADGSKTLLNVSRSKWERRWPAIAGIQIPESNDAVSRYLALHLFRFKCKNYPFIEFYNPELLNRFKRPSE